MSRDDSASPKAACLHLAGERAKIGAGVGTAAGFMRRNQERRQQAQVNKQAMAQYQADLDRYSQAFAACMQGRGYVVR